MTASDQKKALLLGLLVILAGCSWYFVFRPMMAASPTDGTAAAKPPVKGAKGNKKIDPGLIDLKGLESFPAGDVGQRNIFTFPPKLPPKPQVVAQTTPQVFTPAPSTAAAPPQPPPPPPFKAFKYEGFSVMKNSGGKLKAAISEGGNSYQVFEGDCILGQYCITRVTDTQIEIEDLQSKRRQPFARVQQ